MRSTRKHWLLAAVVVIAAGGGYYAWSKLSGNGLPEGIASGNGRIEAAEIDISTKTAGRVREILANEGDFVAVGQVLARMETEQLEAQRRQAEAQLQRAMIGVDTAKSLVTQREAERTAAVAVVAQREAELDAAARKLARSEQLARTNRVKAQIPPALLRKYIQQVKTGLPGMVYVRLDPQTEWPASLSGALVQ
ncbi:biotin/lipoyl-binding protein [Ensifer sp. IC3342]|nr:biotin/lipoyl-binding protein [Ensifer sp. BRP08]MCA1450827.1 biotin/lipoyl-binding protein [Ensifer sp. IC3342]